MDGYKDSTSTETNMVSSQEHVNCVVLWIVQLSCVNNPCKFVQLVEVCGPKTVRLE